jgi:antitoxin ParD1/3/4
MTQVQLTLPDATSEFIQAEAAAGGYSTVSEYVRFLIEQARAAKSKQTLDDLLEDGLKSGPPIQFSAQWWSQRKAALLASY